MSEPFSGPVRLSGRFVNGGLVEPRDLLVRCSVRGRLGREAGQVEVTHAQRVCGDDVRGVDDRAGHDVVDPFAFE